MRITAAMATAVLLTGIAWAATPGAKSASLNTASAPAATASGPASTSKPALPPVLADTFLRAFPGSANSLAGRPDARNLHIEGRVREIHSATLPSGDTETRLILVGSSQADEAPAHFTCHVDKLPDDIKAEQIVRLTGTVGPIVAAGDRVELNNCHDVTLVGDPTVGNRLAGFWRCRSLVLDGATLHKEALAQHKKADDIPTTDFASALRMELAIKNDASFLAELWDGETLIRKVAGKCTITKDGPDSAEARLEGGGTPATEAPVAIENDHLKITLPGFADKHIVDDTAFEKVSGVPQKVDPKAVRAQALAWFKSNTKLAQPEPVLTTMANGMDANAARNNWYVQSMGSDLLKKGKAAVLLTLYGKLTVLEFSDVQTQHDANRKTVNNFGQIGGATLMVPEVKIENLAFDQKGAINATQPITGKVTVRGLRKALPQQYVLLMQLQNAILYWVLDKPISADSETYDFNFKPIGPLLQANVGATIPMVISIARHTAAAGAPGDLQAISEPIISLVDLSEK